MMKHTKNHKGFTIVELMFATVIFSIIMLIALAALVQIGNLYYKGVTTAQTQEVTRNVMDEISQSIQLSAGKVLFPAQAAGATGPNTVYSTNTTNYFCVGDTLYTYAIDRAQTDGTVDATKKEIHHALWSSYLADCATNALVGPRDLTQDNPGGVKGHELLGTHMRLLKLNVSNPVATVPDVWRVDVTVGYGDEDLFDNDVAPLPVRKYCRTANAGTQFCATSELSTIINRRIGSSAP